MNNKGFAITTILYGIMVLSCILLVSLLGILSSYRKTQDILTESNNGTRDIVKYEKIVIGDMIDTDRIIYCMDDAETNCCLRGVSDRIMACESY